MAKKRSDSKTARRAGPAQTAADNDQLAAAAAAIEQAQDALRKATSAYERAREQVAERASEARAITVGDILDGTLEFTRRHPAVGLLTAGLIGLLIGRTGRR